VKAIAPKAPMRRDLHDQADDAEENVRGLLDHVEDQRAAAAEAMQRKAEQHREQQHLEHLALGECIDGGVGNDVHQRVDHAGELGRAGIGFDALRVERVRGRCSCLHRA
jgi:hypothetical protein